MGNGRTGELVFKLSTESSKFGTWHLLATLSTACAEDAEQSKGKCLETDLFVLTRVRRS